MNMLRPGEGLYGYRPPADIEARLQGSRQQVALYAREGGNKLLEASTRVSLANEILSIEKNDPTAVSVDLMVDAMDQLIIAAGLYDENDHPLDGWKQRARVLSILQGPEFGRDELRYQLADRIDGLRAKMDEFGDQILTYKSTVSEVPRYINDTREVLAVNKRLGVRNHSGNGISHEADQIGV